MTRTLVFLTMLVVETLGAATVTFNGGVTYQTIEGFGANINHRSWTNDDLKPVIDALVDQAGMTLFRVIYDKTDWEAANENASPYVMNWSYYDAIYSSPEFEKMWGLVGYLNQKGISNGVMFNFQGNGPAWLGVPALNTGMEPEWAQMVASLLIYARQTNQLQFGLVGPDNEMDQTVQGVNMTASQYVTALHDLSQLLDTNGMSDLKFVGPDLANASTTYMSQMLADPVVMSKAAHFGLHSYASGGSGSAGVASYIQSSAYPDRTVWMTEFNVWCASCDAGVSGTDSWSFARGAVAYLSGHLANGATAGLVWEGYDSQYNYYNPGQWDFFGLFAVDDTNAVDKTYTPRKIFYTLSQVSKWVRPGAQMIGVTGSTSSFSPLMAFNNTGLGQITIVGINTSGSAATLNGALVSLPTVPYLDLYYTSATTNLADGGSVAVNNGTFSATIPANCVFTLTGFTGVNVRLTNPVNGAQFTAPATIPLAATATSTAGSIALVGFYNGATELGEATTAPYGFTWNNVPMGNYALTALAGDTLGNVGTSAVVNVTVVGPLAQIGVTPASATVISAAPSGMTAANTLTVQASPLVMSTTSMPTGTVSVAYSATLSATGGTTPYTWAIANGSLPGGLALSAASGAISGTPANAGTFTFTAQVSDAGSPQQVASNTLSVTISSAPTSVTIWPSTAVPGRVDGGSTRAAEVGVKFRSDVAGTVAGIRFYKASANTGSHVGNLWTSGGSRLATATFTGETASGWQQVNLATPVAISANTTYVASYHVKSGHFSADANAFSTAGVDNPPLHALPNSVTGGNGVYRNSSSSAFPNTSGKGTNYWVDVVFQPTVPLTLTSIAVTAGNTAVLGGTTQQFTATGTYSDGSTQNISGLVTWTSSSAAVATISASGLATALAAGSTTISATLAGVTGSTTLTVQNPPTLASIAVTPANPSIVAGATQQFTATGTYSDGSTQNVTSQATWSSSKTAVATINTNGLATAVSAGAAVISAALSGVTATNTLTVQAAPLVVGTTSMATGTVSVAYSATLLATGGTAPYTWGIASGSLPGGLALNTATGAVTGTPTNTGTLTFTAWVGDAGSPQQIASNALSITISSAPTTVTIWPSTAVPTVADDGPDSAVELGVKFRSDVNGEITGIRFYKAAANTGTHVGNLWSTNGTLLGSITFSNETASGWQQMLLASPVAITANTVYVASYHCTVGHYSEDDNYFASKGVDNPPLHALANTVSADGVYTYGSSSAFPSSTWESANYWVDVTFLPSASNSNAPPTITTQPQSVSVLVSNAATFNVTASGGGTLSYQWSMGGTNVTGATASSWTVTLDTPQTNTVFVSISSIYGSIVSSNAIYAVLPSATNSNAPPTITTQPQSVSVLVSNAATFNVTASGGGTLSYQWSMGGTNVTGATASSWTVTLDTPQTNTVFVSISSIYGSIVSSNAIYAVIANGLPEQISIPPANASVQVKSNATFSVTASGTPPLNYQWSWYGTNLAGATTSMLTISKVTYGDNNSVISVACTNAYGGASASAYLTVTSSLPAGTWVKIFDDEFQTPTINTNNWNLPGTPMVWVDNPTELEAYTATNVVQTNGMLQLWAYHTTYGTNAYTSGKVTTGDKFWNRYGYFEASIKLPSAQNLWPVWWCLMEPYTNNVDETSWPPEIDIEEVVGMPGGLDTSETSTVWWGGNYPLSGGGGAGDYSITGSAPGSPDLTAGFHAYGYLWTPTSHTFYIDGVSIGSTTTHPYTVYPMFLLIQLSIYSSPVGTLPQAMEINYVRAYELSSQSTAVPVITAQPVGQTINSGGPFLLTTIVNSSVSPGLTYQWQHAGTNLPGATSWAYSQAAATPSMAGVYACAITNASGGVLSANATISIISTNPP